MGLPCDVYDKGMDPPCKESQGRRRNRFFTCEAETEIRLGYRQRDGEEKQDHEEQSNGVKEGSRVEDGDETIARTEWNFLVAD
eukprot:749528-Hanusia_phi.AAC.2